jgi:hypothetical protein
VVVQGLDETVGIASLAPWDINGVHPPFVVKEGHVLGSIDRDLNRAACPLLKPLLFKLNISLISYRSRIRDGICIEGRTFKVELRRACQTESVDKVLCPAALTDRLFLHNYVAV